jgi:hypothetical protein
MVAADNTIRAIQATESSESSPRLIKQIKAGLNDCDVIGPLVVAVILLLVSLLKWGRRRRSQRLTYLLVAIALGLVVIASVDLFSPKTARGRWDLAAFPTIVVLAHGFAQFRLRRPQIPASAGITDETERLRRSVIRQFGAVTLILRYLVPGFFIMWFCIGVPNTLLRELAPLYPATRGLLGDVASATEIPWSPAASIAGLFGVAGAYCYVVLNLGYRAFRDDITPGAAYWCAVTLAAGPIIAGVIGMFWPPLASAGKYDTERMLHVSTFFIVGFSPRYGIAIIEAAARAGWKSVHAAETANVHSLPVTALRGVTRDTAARLAEEGITSVSAMAAADPVRLLRNTRYDKSQIVGWVDRALLIDTLPVQWEALEGVGISTASSVTALKDDTPTRDGLARLAKVEPLIIANAAVRLAGDPRFKLLSLLSQAEIDGDMDVDDEEPEAARHSLDAGAGLA